MSLKSKDMRKPLLARPASVRSSSISSSRSSLSSWHPDASVRLFIDRSRDVSPFDNESSLGSETDLTSGRTSPEPRYDLSPVSSTTAQCKTQALKNDTDIKFTDFTPDMPTSVLVAAARDAAAAVAAATNPGSYSPIDEPEFYVGFGILPKKEVTFRRPRRARANQWALATRRYVDILS
ncbi:unnamed protein product [Rhizoctonia solani]|uniref:Uncharacterized protein n=1 Tax=Rhizoctonia solani TaxID=456999 RepID=A0A8H2WU12_9AGAM|nr:unnamed protein product [Rhizoctonia solani]